MLYEKIINGFKRTDIIKTVEKTDAKEILETALGLELEIDQIKAARLLHK